MEQTERKTERRGQIIWVRLSPSRFRQFELYRARLSTEFGVEVSRSMAVSHALSIYLSEKYPESYEAARGLK